jgi:hypothetical protein
MFSPYYMICCIVEVGSHLICYGDLCYNSNVGNHYVFGEVTSNFKLCKFCFNCSANMFSCFALQMITKNFEDYPEHRLKFFSLLRAIATHCFPALIRLSSQVCVKIFLSIELSSHIVFEKTLA